MILRFFFAVAGLAAVGYGWYVSYVPPWIAVPALLSLMVVGLNLDWRRNKVAASDRAWRERRRKVHEERDGKNNPER